jgi:hypothetical protein
MKVAGEREVGFKRKCSHQMLQCLCYSVTMMEGSFGNTEGGLFIYSTHVSASGHILFLTITPNNSQMACRSFLVHPCRISTEKRGTVQLRLSWSQSLGMPVVELIAQADSPTLGNCSPRCPHKYSKTSGGTHRHPDLEQYSVTLIT